MIVIKPWNTNKFLTNGTHFPPKYIFSNDDKLKNIQSFNDEPSPNFLQDLRKAGECHRAVRKYVQSYIKPNIKITDICNMIENKIVEYTKFNNLSAGIAFPVGLSLNNVIAHDSANQNDNRVIGQNDVCKIDFGIHFNGHIIDCAFSAAFNDIYEPLLLATRDATWTGIKFAGPDAMCNELSQHIQEVIESYEIELNGKIYPIKAVRNLGGHSIDRYCIHSGTYILSCPSNSNDYTSMRMQENRLYAIETFATTGTGNYTYNNDNINHYMLNKQNINIPNFNFKVTKSLYQWIIKNRSTLPFSPKWISDTNIGNKLKFGLNELVNKNVIIPFPPLCDIPTSYSSQFEHTIYIHSNGKEVLSAGDDF